MDLGKLHEDVCISINTPITKTPIIVDLQLFGEKTEKPTSKKKSDARKDGNVVKSKDLTSAIQLLAVLVGFNILKDGLSENVVKYTQTIFQLIAEPDRLSEIQFLMKVMRETIETLLIVILPILFISMATAVIVLYAQVGVLFTVKPIQPKLSKINPLSGFKRLFSLNSLVELAKSIIKASLLLLIAGTYLHGRKDEFFGLLHFNLGQILFVFWDVIYHLMIRVSIFLIVVGVLDYMFKRWKNEKDLRMTKQEVKDEYKQSEGDPKLKAKIKQKQREMAVSRMMQEVPKADVIITNPTHYAVAVLYDPDKNDAPMVVAKGKNLIAQRIKDIANDNDIPIVENKPMARALYAQVEWGEVIPETLYHGVAEILAYVYRLKEKN